MTDEEMKLHGIFRDEKGRYHWIPTSPEIQDIIDKYRALKKKYEDQIINALNQKPTKEGIASFIKFFNKQNNIRNKALAKIQGIENLDQDIASFREMQKEFYKKEKQ